MERKPLISVIIVSWNARKYLEQCLGSLTEAACCYPMEIIVVDNASTDGAAECVEKQFAHVRLIRNDSNLGFAKANNLGIARSRGEYVCFVNSDVKVLPGCITRLVDYCQTHRDVGLAGPRIIGGDGKLQRSCRGYPSLWNMFCRALALDTLFPRVKLFCGYGLSHWPHDAQMEVDILSGCFWLARRQALDHVGFLDERFFIYGEDMDWCRRFQAGGWKLVFLPSSEAIHYGGASSANAPARFHFEQQKADLQYWRKHHSRLGFRCYFLIAALHQALRVAGYSLALCFGRKKEAGSAPKIRGSLACLAWMLRGRVPPGAMVPMKQSQTGQPAESVAVAESRG